MVEATEEAIQGGAGNLFVRSWRPASVPRAIVAICHGFDAHSGIYAWCGDRLAQAGIAAHAFDLRGRGRSDGERFYVESFEEYVDDLDKLVDFAKFRDRDVPLVLWGTVRGRNRVPLCA